MKLEHFGSASDSVATTDTGTFAFFPLMKRLLQHLSTISTRKPDFQDLELVINVMSIAVGATVYSDYTDNIQWVRQMALYSQCDQTYDIVMTRRNSLPAVLLVASDVILVNSAPPRIGGLWSGHVIAEGNADGNGTPGNSARWGIANKGVAPATVGKLVVHLMGGT